MTRFGDQYLDIVALLLSFCPSYCAERVVKGDIDQQVGSTSIGPYHCCTRRL